MNAAFVIAGDRESGVACPHCASAINPGDEAAVCRACGTAHHRDCWDQHARCGSYNCAPARRSIQDRTAGVWSISQDELRSATPLPPRPAAFSGTPMLMRPPKKLPRYNQMAVAALVVAVVGIPLFGVLTGLVAVVLACVALGAIQKTEQKGTLVAVAGIMLGLADVVGWVIFISVYLGRGGGGIREADLHLAPTDLSEVAPTVAQALRANVLITAGGPFSGGLGSGVILKIDRSQAFILTNRHVVDPSYDSDGSGQNGDASRLDPVEIMYIGQTTTPGRTVWLAPLGIDLAIVKAACAETAGATAAQAALWRAGTTPHIGDAVFAIGNPHGLGWTHTAGSISQFRVLDKSGGAGGRDLRVLQTSTAINPGNSGGGLYDQAGSLIGINTWSDDKSVSEGLSFAIMFESFLELLPPDMREIIAPAAPPTPEAPHQEPAP